MTVVFLFLGGAETERKRVLSFIQAGHVNVKSILPNVLIFPVLIPHCEDKWFADSKFKQVRF